jgi:hypothetical protein
MTHILKFLFLLISTAPLLAETSLVPPPVAPAPLPLQEKGELVVNNRILAKINGKIISVIDVMKKMDVFLNQNYPQFVDSKVARFQFYSTQWRNVLSQIIDQELVLSDSEGMDLKISDGDVREILLQRFGPNVMANLEKIGISYEEAREMIHSELVVQRMYWYRVNSKAILSVNPQDVKIAFKDFSQKNPPLETWKYQVLSVRGKDQGLITQLSNRVELLLKQPDASLDTVYTLLKDEETAEKDISFTLTPLNEVNMKNLSASHKNVLSNLTPETISHPIQQPSRDGSLAVRFFYLKEHIKQDAPTFEKISDRLQDELIEKAVGKETNNYLARLRRKFSFEEKSIPSDFQPFALK